MREDKVLKVTGKGNIKVKPDMTRVSMELECICKQYDKALSLSASNSGLLRKVITSLGFDEKDMKTVSFDVSVENSRYTDNNGNWKTRFEGYKVSHVLKIEFESDNVLLGKILGAIATCPARPVFKISFFVKDKEGVKNTLLGNAVKDAKVKASVLAEASGIVLKEITSIDYSWGELRFESRQATMEAAQIECCDMMAIDIEPDDIEASDSVTVTWAIA